MGIFRMISIFHGELMSFQISLGNGNTKQKKGQKSAS